MTSNGLGKDDRHHSPTVGADISKLTLDVYLHPQATARQFANSATGIKVLLAWLGQSPVHRIVFEPTGAYHPRAPTRRCRRTHGQGRSLQARRFAEAIRQRANRCHARLVRRVRRPANRPIVSQPLSTTMELLVAHRGLVKDRVGATSRNHAHRSPLLKRLSDQRLRQLERQIAGIDAELRARCRVDAELKARRDILVSIPGIGEATALAMLIERSERGTIDSKYVASLANLTPIARDSGQHSGKRLIRSGRAHLRQTLYITALVAIRFNADMKAKYQALLAIGKPPKVAIVAVMRQLAILANVLLRKQRCRAQKAAG